MLVNQQTLLCVRHHVGLRTEERKKEFQALTIQSLQLTADIKQAHHCMCISYRGADLRSPPFHSRSNLKRLISIIY